MFDDSEMTFDTGHATAPRASASVNSAPPSVIDGGRASTVSGVTLPSSMAPAAATSFITEPGSYTPVSAALSALGRTSPELCSARTLAMARISPVRGLLTTAMAPLAPAAFTWSARIRSTSNCRLRSMVRTRSLPLTAGITWFSPIGMVRPSGVCSMTTLPGSPVRSSANCRSSPEIPLPSTSVVPTIPAARSPEGVKRRGSCRKATPGSASAFTLSARSSGTWRAM
ncbi:MAG: hypothetical protein R2726_00080 [Acidimicrobiales bacterium]